MRALARLGSLCAALLLCVLAGVAHAEPQNGWWWNPAESGRGFFIEFQGDVLFMAAYFYEADGRSTWLVSAGGFETPYRYSGRLYSVTGGQSLYGDYRAPVEVDAGAIEIEFSDDTHGTLTWPGGTIAIERQVFATGEASFQPTGWWWNPDESGRGFCIEVQGGFLFMAGFMYDEPGNPVWYISAGKLTTPKSYLGSLLSVNGGQTMGGPYKPPLAETPVGTVAIEFASLEEATLTFTEAPALKSGAAASTRKAVRFINVRPQLVRSAQPWAIWNGYFREESVVDRTTPFGKEVATLSWRGTANWVQPTPSDPGEGPEVPLMPAKRYVLRVGTLNVEYLATQDIPGGKCTTKGSARLDLASQDGHLYIYESGLYHGIIHRDAIPMEVKETCVISAGSAPPVAIGIEEDFHFEFSGRVTRQLGPSGTATYRHMQGRTTTYPDPDTVVKDNWDFSE